MAIFVNEQTKVVVQGLTGGQGRFHGLRNRAYGTQVVGGVVPGKGGTDVEGIPVFDSVKEAVAATGADASFVAVPPKFAPGAILEAAEAGIAFVVCITEGIPAQDEAKTYNTLVRDFPGTRLLGPNCLGILNYVNKTLLDQKGIPMPAEGWTWDDWVEIATQVNDKDAGIYGSSLPVPLQIHQPYFMQAGASGPLTVDTHPAAPRP